MRRLPSPACIVIVILCAAAYAGSLFGLLVLAVGVWLLAGPSIVQGRLVRDIRRIAQAQGRR